MTVKALYDYDYPSADRVELFGDDELVYVHWRGNLLFSSAGCFRAPKAMTFGEFRSAIVDAWAESDPEYDSASVHDWQLFDEPLEADPGRTLADLGIGHKALLSFAT
ncbi:phenol hydroxylase subunit P4 [Aldersonia kunmingensis]|uniref:phenol hydroxylase subunit P4 n=1 Tax=Aldersonia kunmingensis TaxID=408066 RepID=UPI00083553C5|nr:phenol hydroxylase subunit P4 [Aldersonia kunmingensis]